MIWTHRKYKFYLDRSYAKSLCLFLAVFVCGGFYSKVFTQLVTRRHSRGSNSDSRYHKLAYAFAILTVLWVVLVAPAELMTAYEITIKLLGRFGLALNFWPEHNSVQNRNESKCFECDFN